MKKDIISQCESYKNKSKTYRLLAGIVERVKKYRNGSWDSWQSLTMDIARTGEKYFKELEDENKRLRKALKVYEDEDSWTSINLMRCDRTEFNNNEMRIMKHVEDLGKHSMYNWPVGGEIARQELNK